MSNEFWFAENPDQRQGPMLDSGWIVRDVANDRVIAENLNRDDAIKMCIAVNAQNEMHQQIQRRSA